MASNYKTKKIKLREEKKIQLKKCKKFQRSKMYIKMGFHLKNVNRNKEKIPNW